MFPTNHRPHRHLPWWSKRDCYSYIVMSHPSWHRSHRGGIETELNPYSGPLRAILCGMQRCLDALCHHQGAGKPMNRSMFRHAEEMKIPTSDTTSSAFASCPQFDPSARPWWRDLQLHSCSQPTGFHRPSDKRTWQQRWHTARPSGHRLQRTLRSSQTETCRDSGRTTPLPPVER